MENETSEPELGELNQPIWAVVSSDRCEATDLTYTEAGIKMAEFKSRRIHGLTIITAAAAARIGGANA